MSLNEEILKMLKCCLHSDEHIVKEAVLLKCGGNACKSCVSEILDNAAYFNKITCYFCYQTHKPDDLENLNSNPQVSVLIESTFFNELIAKLDEKYENTMMSIEELDKDINENLQLSNETIEQKINERIEKIKSECDKHAEQLRQQFLGMKEKIQKPNLQVRKVRSIMKEKLEKNDISIDTFYKYQNDLATIRGLIQKQQVLVKNPLAEFTMNMINLDLSFIGRLSSPISCKFEKFRSSNSYIIDTSKQLQKCIVLKTSNQIVVTDARDKYVYFVNLNDKDANRSKKLEFTPWHISLFNESHIFLADQSFKKFAFLSNKNDSTQNKEQNGLKFVRGPLKEIYQFEFDAYSINGLGYGIDLSNNQVIVYDSSIEKITARNEINSIGSLKICSQNVLVSAFTGTKDSIKSIRKISTQLDIDTNIKSSKSDRDSITNSIYILEKETLRIVRLLKLDNWVSLKGLAQDDDLNVITTAYEIESDQIKASDFRFFILIDRNNCVLRKIRIQLTDFIYDIQFFDAKLIFCLKNGIQIMELE